MSDDKKKQTLDELLKKVGKSPLRPQDKPPLCEKMQRPEPWPEPPDDSSDTKVEENDQ